jgi:hypothetical protein
LASSGLTGIACGLLGGFGGFLSEDFRAHDYQLGRLNAYLFLRESFSAPLTNKILAKGYAAASAQLNAFKSTPVNGTDYYQIIPLVGTAETMPTPPVWPRVSQKEVDTFVDRAEGRVSAVVNALLKQKVRQRLLRLLVRPIWNLFGSGPVTNGIRWAMTKDLLTRDQLQGPFAGKPDECLVMAALADTAFDFRTMTGIAGSTGLPETNVARILTLHKNLIYSAAPLKSGGPSMFTLRERSPGFLRRIPLIGGAITWAFKGDPVVG